MINILFEFLLFRGSAALPGAVGPFLQGLLGLFPFLNRLSSCFVDALFIVSNSMPG